MSKDVLTTTVLTRLAVVAIPKFVTLHMEDKTAHRRHGLLFDILTKHCHLGQPFIYSLYVFGSVITKE
jgi:hypothetical protein